MIIRLGIPNRVITFFVRNLLAASVVVLTTGSASIHFVNVSIMMKRNSKPRVLLGMVLECLVPTLQKSKKDVWFAKLVSVDVLVDYEIDIVRTSSRALLHHEGQLPSSILA